MRLQWNQIPPRDQLYWCVIAIAIAIAITLPIIIISLIILIRIPVIIGGFALISPP